MPLIGNEDYINCLVQMVSYGSTTFPSVMTHLQSILSLCKRKWICDFLFNDDPMHLHVLTGPAFLRNAVACDIKIKRFQPPNMQNPYDYHFDCSIVFVPAFSVENVSVGFGLEEKQYSTTHALDTNGPPGGAHRTPRYNEQFRYVRDDKAGTLTIMYTHDDYYQFEFCTHLSTKHRQRSTSRFNRHALMSLVQRDNTLDEDKVLPAMLWLLMSDEYRRCPTCGASPDLNCSCTLDLIPPSHPLDFSNHARQMSTHAGSYEGLMHMMKLENGRTTEQIFLGNRINLQGGTSRDLVKRLAGWAVSQHLRDVYQDPMSSVFPSADTSVEWDVSSMPVAFSQPQTMSASFEAGGTATSQGILGQGLALPDVDASHAIDDGSHALQITPAVYSGTALSGPIMPQLNEPASSAGEVGYSQPANEQSQDVDNDNAADSPHPGHQNPGPAELQRPMTAAEMQQYEKEKEKERKRELKKHRNRLSAQKSNMKKKKENDAKKAELRELKEKEVRYRENEQRLRIENVRLRKLVHGASSSEEGQR